MTASSWTVPGAAALAHAVATLTPQLLALVLLAPEPFGIFSLGYLFFALASSVVLSFLCDSWLVLRRKDQDSGWSSFSTLAVAAGVLFGTVAGLGIAMLATPAVAAVSAAAVGLSTYRTCLRYHLVGTGRWLPALRSDLQTLAGLAVAGLGALLAGAEPNLELVLATWTAGSAAGVLVGPAPRLTPRGALAWVRSARTTIRPLMADSVAADAASIGVPFLMLPLLGLPGFAVYRAVANLSAPIRLVAAPLRPVLVASPVEALRPRPRTAVLVLAALAGVITWALVRGATRLDGDTVLLELTAYPVALGAYVAGSVLLSYFPLVCRARPGRPLRLGRAVHTALGVVLPLAGVALAGLDGAVWGFAAAAALSGAVWCRMALLSVQDGPR